MVFYHEFWSCLFISNMILTPLPPVCELSSDPMAHGKWKYVRASEFFNFSCIITMDIVVNNCILRFRASKFKSLISQTSLLLLPLYKIKWLIPKSLNYQRPIFCTFYNTKRPKSNNKTTEHKGNSPNWKTQSIINNLTKSKIHYRNVGKQ